MSHAILVSYDVIHDDRRRKIYKALHRLGRRIQYSVFLVEHRSPDIIRQRLEGLLDRTEDNVRIHPLCATCAGQAILLGRARSDCPPPGFEIL